MFIGHTMFHCCSLRRQCLIAFPAECVINSVTVQLIMMSQIVSYLTIYSLSLFKLNLY